MSGIQDGETVLVHYKGQLKDGTVFDSSAGREPLEVAVGQGQVIPGFEQALRGMEVGDSKSFDVPCAEAYGPRSDEMVFELPRAQMADDVQPEPGQTLQLTVEGGGQYMVQVVAVTDEIVKVDGNHPLAGQDLNFEIEVVERKSG